MARYFLNGQLVGTEFDIDLRGAGITADVDYSNLIARYTIRPAAGVYDIQDSTYGTISATDALNNNGVFQAAANDANANGGGIIVVSRDILLRPRATQAVSLGSNTTITAVNGAVITVDTANSPHTVLNGSKTLTATGASLPVASTAAFEASGSLLIRGTTDDLNTTASYTSVTATTFEGCKLSAAATTLVGAHALPAATVTVRSSSGYAVAGTINVGGQIVNYTGKSGQTMDTATGLTTSSFTGCTGGTGTIADGSAVTPDSAAFADATGVGQSSQVFQNKDTTNGNDDIVFDGVTFLGPGRLGSTTLTDLTTKAVRLTAGVNNTDGSLGWCRRSRIQGCTFRDWAGPHLHLFNQLDFHFDSNTFYNGWRGGIIGGADSHRGTINGNVFESHHDDCINWAGRGQVGGIGPGATYPTRFEISGNFVQEADYSTETAQINNAIVVRGGQHFEIASNIVEGSDDVASIAAGISLRNIGITDIKHAKVVANRVFNTGAVGIQLMSGDGDLSGGTMDDVTVEANDVYNTQGPGVWFNLRNVGATMTDVALRGGQLRDCGASGVAAIKISNVAGAVGPTITGLVIDDPIVVNAGAQALTTDGFTSLETIDVSLKVRNPNRYATASTDAIKIDCSGTGATLTNARIAGSSVVVDNGNSVRFGIVVQAGANGTDVRLRRNALIKSQFTTGAYSITAGGTRVSVESLNPGAVVALTDAAGVAVDTTLGDYFTLSAGASRTILAPSGGFAGHRITFDILNNTGGAITTGWNLVFKMPAWTDPAAGMRKTVVFENVDGTNYVQVGTPSADI